MVQPLDEAVIAGLFHQPAFGIPGFEDRTERVGKRVAKGMKPGFNIALLNGSF
jgi:hypothetical protein